MTKPTTKPNTTAPAAAQGIAPEASVFGWSDCTLSDVTDIVAGYAFKGSHFGDIGEKVVKIKDITPPTVDLKNVQRVDFANYSKSKLEKYKVVKNDYVVAMTGATIGKVGRLISNDEAYINQRVAKIDSKKTANKDFIYYCLVGEGFEIFIQNNIDSHSAQENISASSIGRYPIKLPPLPEQKAIAAVLSSLDDKIDLLHRQNQTLEAMAQTLFRQWFIEEAREDWKDSLLKDEFDFTMGQSPTGSSFNEEKLGMPMFQGNADFGFRFPTERVYTTEPTRFAEPFDTLISVRAPVGAQNMAKLKCCIGRGVAAFRYKNNPDFYTYTYYKLHSLMDEIKQFNDEGTVFGSISKSDFENLTSRLPDKNTVMLFEAEAKPLNDKIILNCDQIQTLIQLRDTLLPKLMSGEVRII